MIRLAPLRVELDTVELLLEPEIDHAGDRIGAVYREAPPVMISTLSIKEPGMMLRSTTPLPFAGISRLPSISTSVDVLPRPRSWTLA